MKTRKRINRFTLYFAFSCLVPVILFIFLNHSIKLRTQEAAELLKKNTGQFLFLVELEKRRTHPLKLPVLVYHYVEVVTDLRDTIRQSLSITPAVFENQLLTLKKYGYTPIHLEDLVQYYDNQTLLPAKPVVLTFDDGYADFYTDVLPIITRLRVPVTLFMVSGFLDSTRNYLTTEQFRKIVAADLVEIGAHTVHHLNFHYIPLTLAQEEIVQSKIDLEKLSQRTIAHFAFPYGSYTPQLQAFAEKSGFKTAATVDLGVTQFYDKRYGLKRIRAGNLSDADFINYIEHPIVNEFIK